MDWDLILGIGRFVLATTLILLLTVPTAFVIIQMEMKIIAQLALRYGPNRIGPRGVFQSTIHGFKVLAKEDTVPDQADRGTFTLAPWMVYMAAAMSMIVIPFAPGAIAADSSPSSACRSWACSSPAGRATTSTRSSAGCAARHRW
jgi:NADH:ubiquinone oxidoreductase subunit H